MTIIITTHVSARDISVQMTDDPETAAEILVSFASEGWSNSDDNFIRLIKLENDSFGEVGKIALRQLGELLVKAAE